MDLPRSWLRFASRQKGAQFLRSRHAAHPINATLNYCYVVKARRLARAFTAIGLALPIGFPVRYEGPQFARLGRD
jgi:hypothetical protein